MHNFTIQTILNSLPYCVWINNENYRMVFTNTAFKEYLGIDVDTRLILSKIIHPDDIEGLRRFYSEDRKYTLVKTIVRAKKATDGEYRWCFFWRHPMFGPENRFCGHMGGFTDIFNVMPSGLDELLLEYYGTKLEDAPFGFVIIDQNNNIVLCNSMYETITGRCKEQLLKSKWMDLVHSDQVYSYNMERLKSGEQEHFHSVRKITRPDQSAAWVFVSAFAIQEKGVWTGKYAFVVQDVTDNIHLVEQSSAHQRFLSVLLADKAGMMFRCKPGPKASISYISEGCYRLTGYNQRFLLQNSEFYFNTVIDKEFREYMNERRKEAVLEKRVHKDEYMITMSTGEKRWVYEQVLGIYDESGECIMLEGLVSDITDSKEKDYELLKKQYHDAVTNLSNRRFLKASCRNLDRIGTIPVAVAVVKVSGLRLVKEALGQSVKEELMVTVSQNITSCCSEKDIIAVTGEDEFTILLPEANFDHVYKVIEQIQARMKLSREKIHSITGLISGFFGCAIKESPTESLCDTISRARKNLYVPFGEEKCCGSFPSIYNVQRLTRVQHTERGLRIKKLCRRIGERYHLDESEMNRLEILSVVHNMGISEVSTNILCKQGALTQDEWVVIKMHPEIGYRMAVASMELGCVAEEILYHHEWWNGTGYPKGLKGEQIPLLSRILTVADSYDAMTNQRPFRNALSKKEAIEKINMDAGIQYDPAVVEIFLLVMEEEGLG